jgi:hypothetical protein
MRVLREYRKGEEFLYLGRSYRLLSVEVQTDLVSLKGWRFCLRRDLARQGRFRDYYVERGVERIPQRLEYFAPKVGVKTARCCLATGSGSSG